MNRYGFYIWLRGNKDIFVETNQVNKTERLARKILKKLGIGVTEGNIKEIIGRMQRGVCEIKESEHGRYYNIHGENYGGYGHYLDGRDGGV